MAETLGYDSEVLASFLEESLMEDADDERLISVMQSLEAEIFAPAVGGDDFTSLSGMKFEDFHGSIGEEFQLYDLSASEDYSTSSDLELDWTTDGEMACCCPSDEVNSMLLEYSADEIEDAVMFVGVENHMQLWDGVLLEEHGPRIHQSLLFSSTSVQRSNLSSSKIQHYDNFNPIKHKDWLSPTQVIKIFQNLKDPNSALNLWTQMSKRKDYTPNEALYSAVINKLAEAKNIDAIETLMERIKLERKCRLSDAFFHNVIRIYGNVGGRINKAIETLFDMPNYKCWPSVKTFNFVLNLLVNTKQFEVIHRVYTGAANLGVEIDACCLNIIVKGLCNCGKLEGALQVLDEFPKQNCSPNVRTFSTIMRALCDRGRVNEAFELLERMERERVEPDTIMYNILISGLRKQGRVEEGIEVFNKLMHKGCDPNDGTYQEVLYGLLDAKRFVDAKDFMGVMIDKRVNPSFESYKLMVHGLCDQNLSVHLDWVLKQMMRHGFVPRVGMWKKMVECFLHSKDCCNYVIMSFEGIIADQSP
nr:pentatricopeptide repeat-containing protein At3g14580, mitochondrial-like [Ipomoea batatas]